MDREKTRRKKAIDREKEKDMRRYKLHMDNEKAYLEHIERERERGREREREKMYSYYSVYIRSESIMMRDATIAVL